MTPCWSEPIDGDWQAFSELYVRYVDQVHRYITYRIADAAHAEDMTEMVFLKVWEALPRYRFDRAPFRIWLYKVAGNLVIDFFRTRRQHVSLTAITPLTDPQPQPEQVLIDQESNHRLHSGLLRLNREHQQVLLLRFVGGLSHRETGSVLQRIGG